MIWCAIILIAILYPWRDRKNFSRVIKQTLHQIKQIITSKINLLLTNIKIKLLNRNFY